MFYRSIVLVVSILFSHVSFSFDHEHSIYNELLQSVVVEQGHQTAVKYRLLKEDPSLLEEYAKTIEAVSQSEFDSWNKDQQLAFLINAYNAFTLKLIIDNYPDIDSIRDLGGLIFSSPWDIKFFKLFGEKADLDHIEHDLIRGNFNEARIHFAVNCASRGCPPLATKAYIANTLDEQLDYATRLFLTDPERNRYNAKNNTLELSSIFKWYRQDFVSAAGSLPAFVAPYITDDAEQQKKLQFGSQHGLQNIPVRYLDYDWSLNDASKK